MMYTIPTTKRLYACEGCGTTRIGSERRMLGACLRCGEYTYNEITFPTDNERSRSTY